MSIRQISQGLLFVSVTCQHGVLNPHRRAAEIESAGDHIHHDQVCTGQLDEFDDAQPNRPGTDDQDIFFGLGRTTDDRVTADGQGLDQGELLHGQLGRFVKLSRGKFE